MNENRAGLVYQDFETVRTQQIFYIDKTDFIREWWENADQGYADHTPAQVWKDAEHEYDRVFLF